MGYHGTSLFFFSHTFLIGKSMWRFCAFLNKGEFQNTTNSAWEKPMSKAFGGESRGKKTAAFPLRICFISFLAVSLHEAPKNTIQIFSEI
jgi:hypothetical protein